MVWNDWIPRFSQFMVSVGIVAVLCKLAMAFFLEVVAYECLMVVVRNVE
jgi:hypothetical protein